VALEATIIPRPPYSLALSARLKSDATRVVRHGVLTLALEADEVPALARVRQRPDGSLAVSVEGGAERTALDTVRFVLAAHDDHGEFLERFSRDTLLSGPTRRLRASPAADGYRDSCSPEGAVRPADPVAQRPHARGAAAPSIERERGLGPWSAGMICLYGLGRYEQGLGGDLGLVELCSAIYGRRADADDTRELLAPYGEWSCLASVYLPGGTVPLPDRRSFRRKSALAPTVVPLAYVTGRSCADFEIRYGRPPVGSTR
jgi:hypothetical protein